MLSSHRGLIAYQDAYNRAEHIEEKARAAMDLYRVALEGDVKRTAVVVLELLGRSIPDGISLATARDLLRAEKDQPLCQLLASGIRPEWRNANAHEDFRWDPIADTLLLSGQPTDLDDVLESASRARVVCQGFEHGVAVAYAQNASLIAWGKEAPNHVDRDFSVLQAAGESRFPVLDIRRHRTVVRLDVPDISIETLPDACRALLRAAGIDSGVKRWELRQTSPDRLPLRVDREGLDEGLRIAEPLWDIADPVPFAGLPLLANAMAYADESVETAVSTVLCFAAAHVVGERDRLAPALLCGDLAAKGELISIVKLVGTGVEAAATLIEGAARRKLHAFAEVLSGEGHRFERASPYELIRGLVPAHRALHRHAPARVPWIVSLDDSVA